MDKSESDDAPRSFYWLGWGFIFIGLFILLIANNINEKNNRENKQSFTKKAKQKYSFNYVLDQVNEKLEQNSDLYRKGIAIVAMSFVFYLYIVFVRWLIHFLAVNGPIPSGEFSPALASNIILGILAGFSGWSVDKSWMKIFSNNESLFWHILSPIFYMLLILNVLWVILSIVGFAYSPIQYLLSPNIVEDPILNLGRWEPNMSSAIAILGGYAATISINILIRLNNPVWDWAKNTK